MIIVLIILTSIATGVLLACGTLWWLNRRDVSRQVREALHQSREQRAFGAAILNPKSTIPNPQFQSPEASGQKSEEAGQ